MLHCAIALASILMTTPTPTPAPTPTPTPLEHPNMAADAKVVIALTSGDPQVLREKLFAAIPMMAANYRAQKRGLRAAIVVHGEAYRFVLKDLRSTPYSDDTATQAAQSEIRGLFEGLVRTYGVRIEVCAHGMKKHGLAQANLYPFVHPVASASIALIDWQQAGHALLTVK